MDALNLRGHRGVAGPVRKAWRGASEHAIVCTDSRGRDWQRSSQKRLFKTSSTAKGLAIGTSSFALASVQRRTKKTSAGDGFSNRDTVQECALDKWGGRWEATEDRSVVVGIEQQPRDFPEWNFATRALGAGTGMSPAYESLGPSTPRNLSDAHDVAGCSPYGSDPSMPQSALGSDLTNMASLSRLVADSASESEESTDMDANWFNDALSDTLLLAMHHQADLAASETEDGGDEASFCSSHY
jgi:hypothetical protein